MENSMNQAASTTPIPDSAVASDKSSKIGTISPFPKKAPSQKSSHASKTVPLFSVPYQAKPSLRAKFVHQIRRANKELWLILSMVFIACTMNFMMASHRMLLGFYILPTLFSAYFFGRRHAILTALASVLLVGLVTHYNPSLFNTVGKFELVEGRWYEITAWGGILIITAYAMGTLYEHKVAHIKELHETYKGLLVILRQFISKDKYTENHCYRVSIYAAKIAAQLRFTSEQIEDIRSAALLHDIGKLDISREILYKAARLNQVELDTMKQHVEQGTEFLQPVGGPLGRVIPIILAHHDKYDGSGYHGTHGENIPIEARVLSVADVYDSLVSDRPYRKAMSPFEAKDIIVKGSGSEFDPRVVKAFTKAFRKGEMEVPHLVI